MSGRASLAVLVAVLAAHALVGCAGFIATPPVPEPIPRPPLRSAPGPNRTVAPCLDAIALAAAQYGAREVEAASAGPQRVNSQNNLVAPVHMRVTYAPPLAAHEIREAVITCVADTEGRLLDAF
jgi:hypothetical protein